MDPDMPKYSCEGRIHYQPDEAMMESVEPFIPMPLPNIDA
jgi:hypothetical protein